jgi:hypothetical protein
MPIDKMSSIHKTLLKSYLWASGVLFALFALVQVVCIILEGQNFWLAALFALAGGLSTWAFRLLMCVKKSD